MNEIIFEGNWKSPHTGNGQEEKLTDIFFKEVPNERVAWYIDYFTEDAAQFGVRYLADGDRRLMLTNENKEQRDPSNPESQWGPEDVAGWFSKTTGDEAGQIHYFHFFFKAPTGDLWGLHIEPYRVFAFGPEGLSLPASNCWDEYVEHGVLGPLRMANVMGGNTTLECVSINGDVFGSKLEAFGLTESWLLAQAGILDEN